MAIKELFSQAEIAERVTELAAELRDYYKDKDVTVIMMMNGAVFFASDLLRCWGEHRRLHIDSLGASSYVDDKSCGKLTIRGGLKLPIAQRHVLLVDDILDSGLSLLRTVEYLNTLNPASVKTCVLIDKNVSHTGLKQADWYGFKSPDKYLVGYGMDSEECFRNLPFIGIMRND